MSNNPSKTTKAIACRVPLTVYAILERRAAHKGLKVGKYVERKLEYDALRRR